MCFQAMLHERVCVCAPARLYGLERGAARWCGWRQFARGRKHAANRQGIRPHARRAVCQDLLLLCAWAEPVTASSRSSGPASMTTEAVPGGAY